MDVRVAYEGYRSMHTCMQVDAQKKIMVSTIVSDTAPTMPRIVTTDRRVLMLDQKAFDFRKSTLRLPVYWFQSCRVTICF